MHWSFSSAILFISPLVLPSVVCFLYYVYRSRFSKSKPFRLRNRMGVGILLITITVFAVKHFDALLDVTDAPGGFIALFYPLFACFYGVPAYVLGYVIGRILERKDTHNKIIQEP